jgi:hypothetical protein
MSRGRTWLRRAGYSAGCLVWLLIMCLPLFAFVLAVNGEMSWRRGEFAEDRLWLIQEADQRGLGYSRARLVSNGEPAAGGAICVRTSVIFLLWRGSAEPVQFCECFAAGTREPLGECAGQAGSNILFIFL